jgi:hypothetical protein
MQELVADRREMRELVQALVSSRLVRPNLSRPLSRTRSSRRRIRFHLVQSQGTELLASSASQILKPMV